MQGRWQESREDVKVVNRTHPKMNNLALLIFIGVLSLGAQAENTNTSGTVRYYVKELTKSAEQGNVKAQTCLGDMYREGTMVKGDLSKAVYWFKRAADQGDVRGKYFLALMQNSSPPSSDETFQEYQNRQRALESIHELADRGYAPAETNVGLGYLYQGDYAKALTLLRSAAIQDDADAEVILSFMYKYGYGVDSSITAAQEWSSKVASHKFDCVADYAALVYNLIDTNVLYPKSMLKGAIKGRVLIAVRSLDGKSFKSEIVEPAGNKKLNAAALEGAQNTKYPSWPYLIANPKRSFVVPVNFTPQQNIFLSMLITRHSQYQDLKSAIQYAIQRNVILPKHILIHGTFRTGEATLLFTYRDGSVSDVKIEESTLNKYENQAAIKAVRTAHYPSTPPLYVRKVLHCIITISYGFPPEPFGVSNLVVH